MVGVEESEGWDQGNDSSCSSSHKWATNSFVFAWSLTHALKNLWVMILTVYNMKQATSGIISVTTNNPGILFLFVFLFLFSNEF